MPVLLRERQKGSANPAQQICCTLTVINEALAGQLTLGLIIPRFLLIQPHRLVICKTYRPFALSFGFMHRVHSTQLIHLSGTWM